MKFWIALAVTLWCPNAYCLTKSVALGLSKSRIEGLKNHFAGLAYNCFMFEEDCGITGNSQSATVKWLSFEQRKFKPNIQFDRGADKFLIDGAVRIAKTGNKWGDPVIFNEDLLTVESSPGVFEAIGFYEVLGILVHEFGHHQEKPLLDYGLKALDHHELDLIALRITSYLKDRSRRLDISSEEVPGLSSEAKVSVYQIEIESFNGVRNIWSSIFVDGLAETREVSHSLFKGIACPVERNHEGHITFRGEAAYASFRQLRLPAYSLDQSRLSVRQEVGDASVLCIDETMGVYQVFNGFKDGKLELNFSVAANGLLRFEESSRFRATAPK